MAQEIGFGGLRLEIKLIVLTVAMLINSFATIVSRPEQEPKPISKESGTEIRDSGPDELPFTYDSKIFSKVEVKINPRAIAQTGVDGFPVEAPTHSCYLFEDKRSFPAFEKGARYFYPATSSVCIIPLTDDSVANFPQAYPYLNEAALKLRKLLERRPLKFQAAKDINDLPFNNAGGSIESRVQYLEFQTGTGVLFLTQYSQEMLPNPVNNEELTCNFQGLTNNGKYYVAARLGLGHPSLPRGIDFTEQITRDKHWRYLRKDEQKLNTFKEDSFQPSLKSLKALISSISVR